MTDNILTQRFYGHREPAWHKKGRVSDADETAVEVLESWGKEYEFRKEALPVPMNGTKEDHGFYALIRSAIPDDNTERCFGIVKDNYKILQPRRACELFDEKVKEPVETLGALGHGERMFITWKMPETTVRENDTVNMYGFAAFGFDSLMGVSLNVVTTRIICQNTWLAAINEAENNKEYGKGKIWSGKHNSGNLEYHLGEWMEYVKDESVKQATLVEDFFKKLTQKPLENKEDVYSLLFKAYPNPEPVPDFYPDSLRHDAEQKVLAEKAKMSELRDGIYYVYDGAGTEITQDYWGLFNATTEYFNWGQKSKKDTTNSVLLGNRAKNMNAMAEVLQYEVSK